jgi:Fe-S-cluster formation regulator IscX/YfhJ
MKDQNKTKKQLIIELMELRQRVAELEAFEADHTRVDEELHKWGK